MKNLPTSLKLSTSTSKFSTSTSKSSKGFTLIELLVAITIVAVLGAIGIVVFGGVQQRSRDAKRSGDLQSIVNALEGKRQAGNIFYTALANADFAGGSVPTDPRVATQKYCLWGEVDIPPVAPIATVLATAVDWTTCVGPTVDYTAVVSVGVPADATKVTSFTVCAKKEGVANGIECKSSKL